MLITENVGCPDWRKTLNPENLPKAISTKGAIINI
jgi:hypothetical protein